MEKTDSVKQRRILYVEDDPTLRISTSDLLRDIGHDVVEAADAPAALEWLHAGHPVDVLLTDLRMPLMDGHQLATRARGLRPELIIIFATGASDRTVSEIARDRLTGCLFKPFGHKELEKLLQTLG
jgi:CheY-like chemotaxis protein